MIHEVGNLIAGSKSIIYNDYIVFFISSNLMLPIFHYNLCQIEGILNKYKIYGGLSRRFENILDIHAHFNQAIKAIEFGIQKNNEKVFYEYEEIALYHLFDTHSKRENLKEFCHPSLLVLLEYDHKNNTDYTQTLYIYIMNKGNQAESANLLRIHRGTIIYRIEKIQSIMEITLNDAKIMNHLYLSLIMLKLSNNE